MTLVSQDHRELKESEVYPVRKVHVVILVCKDHLESTAKMVLLDLLAREDHRANQEPMGLLEHLELSDHLVRQGSLVPQVK